MRRRELLTSAAVFVTRTVVWRGAGGHRATPRCDIFGRVRVQLALQESVGHVHWPLGEIVMPQLFPLPLGLATMTYWLGQVALTFQVV